MIGIGLEVDCDIVLGGGDVEFLVVVFVRTLNGLFPPNRLDKPVVVLVVDCVVPVVGDVEDVRFGGLVVDVGNDANVNTKFCPNMFESCAFVLLGLVVGLTVLEDDGAVPLPNRLAAESDESELKMVLKFLIMYLSLLY